MISTRRQLVWRPLRAAATLCLLLLTPGLATSQDSVPQPELPTLLPMPLTSQAPRSSTQAVVRQSTSEGQPPEATMTTRRGRQKTGAISYCWPYRGQTHCTDGLLTDLPRYISGSIQERIKFDIPIKHRPRQVSLELDRIRTYRPGEKRPPPGRWDTFPEQVLGDKLPASNHSTWIIPNVRPGLYAVILSATYADPPRDATWAFGLRITEASTLPRTGLSDKAFTLSGLALLLLTLLTAARITRRP